MGKKTFVLMMALVVAFAALGCLEEKIGGCDVETIKIGTALERGGAPDNRWSMLSIHSVGFAGTDTYAQAAVDLTAVLDSLGITLYSRTDLIHLRQGPCWPPYTVELHIQPTDSTASAAIRSKLLTTPIAGLLPQEERPDGYGTFFIEFSRNYGDGSWVLWYVRALRGGAARLAAAGGCLRLSCV